MGKPYWSVKALTSSYFSTAPSVPGTTGTLAAMATCRAETLSPRPSMTSGEGPTNYAEAREVSSVTFGTRQLSRG